MNYQTPRGTYDILPDEMGKWHDVENRIRAMTEHYRYREIRTPYFESTNVFARANDSSDMVNKEMYTFTTGSDSYTLRPEGTAGVIRAFDQHKLYGTMDLPAKFYYMGAMFRHERPQKGRQRQFHQFGVENIGVKSPEVDAETIALGYDIVKSMDISSVKVLINTLGDDESRAAYRKALKDYFTPHLDELCGDCHRRLEQNPLRILDCKVDHDKPFMMDAPKLSDYLNEESRTYFDRVLAALDAIGIPYEIDERLVRGLDYYNRTVFEIKSNNLGSQNAVCGGGRYDSLVKNLGGEDTPAVGWAMGMERLNSLLPEVEPEKLDGYIVSNSPVDAFALAQELRDAGRKVEFDLSNKKFTKQLEKASKTAKFALILGEDEINSHKVSVKNLETSEQVTVDRNMVLNQLEK